ncbi:MAG: AAA family ATPase [Deltaproteobacteria bacterium]|nr:AAA family ATPase [Deltaproteobacteria bacterium]
MPMVLPPLIEALLNPTAYPDSPEVIELQQTHISYLFFTPHYVYKVKKPVDFGFLDFTTLEKRQFFCHQEVILNRRLAPDVYIGVEAITQGGEEVRMGGKGKIIEYAVKMRRLPLDRMMDRLLANRGEVSEDMIKRVANVIADFHKRATTSPYISSFGEPEIIRVNTEENFQQTKPYIRRTITQRQWEEIGEYTGTFLKDKEGLFLKRIEEGRIKDCHGDIHSEHICITNGIYIFDCIEFNERFRYSDIVADIAFLTMDLDLYNRHDLSLAFQDAYEGASGDRGVKELLDFYECYRAFVRGKVEGFKLEQREIHEEEKKKARRKANRYFHLSHLYATGGYRPILLVFSGLTGTGKTTVAQALSRETMMDVISSDVVRKGLAGIPVTEHRFEGFEEGIYIGAFTERTYNEMINRAEGILKTGRSVILDATFSKRIYRQRAMELARRLGAGFHLIWCVCPEDVIRERLERRLTEGGVPSAGRWEVYLKQKEGFEGIDEAPWSQLDTSGDIKALVDGLLEKVFG